MNKTEAAELLGISIRTLESYVAAGRLSGRYVKGKTRPIADFDAEEVERLRAELAEGTPRTTPNPANSANLATEAESALALLAFGRPNPGVVVIEAAHFQELLGAIAGANSATSQTPQNLAAKLLLTLPEAQILTGLSRETLRRAIGDGALPARQIGRSWRLRPEDVREWLRSSVGSDDGAK